MSNSEFEYEFDHDFLSEVNDTVIIQEAAPISELTEIQRQSTKQLEDYIYKQLHMQNDFATRTNDLAAIDKKFYDYVKEFRTRHDKLPQQFLRELHGFIHFRIGKIIDHAKADSKDVEEKLSEDELVLYKDLCSRRIRFEKEILDKINS